MKKLKYLVIIISLFFTFCKNIYALDTFTCQIGVALVDYYTNGEIEGINLMGKYHMNNVYSDFSPKNKSECPTSENAKIVTLNDELYVTIKSPTSCSSITNQSMCKVNPNFACVWNTKYNYCNVDNLQYVMCGDAHDIPAEIPPITSLFVYLLKIATPIILIVVSIITLLKAISSSKEDEMSKAKNAFVRKAVIAAIIFFVISITQFVITKVADDSEQKSISACMDCFLNNNCGRTTYYKNNISGTYWCYGVTDKIGYTCDEFYKM